MKNLKTGLFALILAVSLPAVADDATSAFRWTAAYAGEVVRNLSGGVAVGTVEHGLFRAREDLRLDGFGWAGGRAVLGVIGTHGRHPSSLIGDVQITSNIEGQVDTGKFYEAFLEQSFGEGGASLLVGLFDFNSEFDVTESSALFFNSSFGVGKDVSQAGANGPSIFPTTSFAVRLQGKTESGFYARTARRSASARGSSRSPSRWDSR